MKDIDMHIPAGLDLPYLPDLPPTIDPVLNAMSLSTTRNRDYRDLTIETIEHERHLAEQRAEGYLLLLGLALDQMHELMAWNRYLSEVLDGLREERRQQQQQKAA